VTIEPNNQEYYIQQGDSSGLTCLKEEMVEMLTKMKSKDIVKIGQAKFLFVPLCVDGFDWKTYLA